MGGCSLLSIIKSLGVYGIKGYVVTVETYISAGGNIPSFDIVGLPDAVVKESRDRVRIAMRNSGYGFPNHKITVSLAPADLRKEGALYDLPVFLGVYAAFLGDLPALDHAAFVGELALNGDLRPVGGVLSMALAAKDAGIQEIFVPADHVALALYALYICLATSGHWFLSFAFPVIGISCLLSTGMICLLKYVRRGRIFIFGGFLILMGGCTMLVEFFEHITFGTQMFRWSLYSISGFAAVGLFLLAAGTVRPLRRALEKRFFF